VKGTGSNCSLVKTCPKVGCDQKLSLCQPFWVVVTQAMLNIVKDLPSLLNYVTAEESARVKTGVHETPNISGVRHRSEPNKPKPRNLSRPCKAKDGPNLRRRKKPQLQEVRPASCQYPLYLPHPGSQSARPMIQTIMEAGSYYHK